MRRWVPWLALAIFLFHAAAYLPFISDDALISLRYSQRLMEGNGLNWNDGEFVEGYSNLLWVLSAAGLGSLGIDLITAVRILGVLCFVITMLAAYGTIRRYSPETDLPIQVVLLIPATASAFAIWSVGGLEQPMVAACLAMAIYLGHSVVEGEELSSWRILLVGLPLGLLCWTRPDGPLFTAAFMIGIFWAQGWSRSVLLVAVLPALFVASQLTFRIFYYGDFLPNTAYVKLPTSISRLFTGANYYVKAVGHNFAFIVPAALTLLLARKHPRWDNLLKLLIPCFVLWSLYVVFIGGDIFPGSRHFVPLLVVAMIACAIGADVLTERYALKSLRWGIWAVLLGFFVAQTYMPMNRAAQKERWEWDGQVVGNLLKSGWKTPPLLAVDAAGCLPFFSGLPSIDMLGLNDNVIARFPTDRVGSKWLGHDHGNSGYVLKRGPDLVIMGQPGGGVGKHYPGNIGLIRSPEFNKRYKLVTFEGADPYIFRSQIWVRIHGGSVGIQELEGDLWVPGYLFAGSDANPVRLVKGERLGAHVSSGQTLEAQELVIPRGRWKVIVDSSIPELKTNFGPIKNGEINLDIDREFTLKLTAGEKSGYLFGVRLQRD